MTAVDNHDFGKFEGAVLTELENIKTRQEETRRSLHALRDEVGAIKLQMVELKTVWETTPDTPSLEECAKRHAGFVADVTALKDAYSKAKGAGWLLHTAWTAAIGLIGACGGVGILKLFGK